MLETIRAFALETLDVSGEEGQIRDRHAAFFQNVAEHLTTPSPPDADAGAQTLHQFEADQANFEAALAWLEGAGQIERLLSLASALHGFWMMRGYAGPALQRLERALERGAVVPDRLRAEALVSLAGMLFFVRHREEEALATAERALALGEAISATLVVIEAAQWSGMSAYRLGRPDHAQTAFAKGLAAHAALPDSPWARESAAHYVNLLGYAALAGGDIDAAEQQFRAAVAQYRTLLAQTDPPPAICYPLAGLGDVARSRGDHDAALAAYQEALAHAHRGGDVSSGLPLALVGVAGTLAAIGRWREAAPLFGATEALCDRTGFPFEEHPFLWQRALELPEPWQRSDEGFGAGAPLHQAVQARGASPVPPIPDPAAAARLWEAGRAIPIEAAIATALAVDLTASAALLSTVPMEALPGLDDARPLQSDLPRVRDP
jgi:tetratricopeptide (TPR) repeat protein